MLDSGCWMLDERCGLRVSIFEAAGFHLLDDVPMTQIIKPKICITNLEGVLLLYDYKILRFAVFLQTLQEESLFALFGQTFPKHSKAPCLNVFGRIVTVGCHVLFVPAHIGVELTDVFVAKGCSF
jgi:hypothetical protein